MKTQQEKKKKLNRVCILNPHGYVAYPPNLGKTDTGGQTLYELELAKALGKRNIKVDIVTRLFDDFAQEEEIFENVKIIRIPCGPKGFVQKEKMYEIIPEFVQNFMHYLEKARKEYSIIHSHYWDAGLAGVHLAKLLDIPHVFTPHSLGKLKKLELQERIETIPTQKLKPIFRFHVRIATEQQIMSKADAVVVICETSRIQILQHYLVDYERIHVIYPGVDNNLFKPTKNGIDKKLEIKPNAVLTVSRMVPAKGLDRVIDALAIIKNNVDFHFYMGGGNTDEQSSQEERDAEKQIRGLVKKYKMEERITFLGQIPHDLLPAYYRAAEVFVLAGRYEPFGMTTLEAMACGTVPIVSHIAGSREVIVDGLNGFIVDTHDRKALAGTIEKLLSDKKLNKKVAENAAFTIQEHYSWDKIVENFITLYTDLI